MERRPKVRWHHGSGRFFYSPQGCYTLSLENGTSVEIHPEVYRQRFNAYLEQLGVQPTSRYEIMQRAEREWQNYCRLIDSFAENTQQWVHDPEHGVFVEPARES